MPTPSPRGDPSPLPRGVGELYPGFDPERAPNGRPWRRAAVLFLLYPRGGETYTVFMERTQTVATHRGQISLPGGAYEPGDASLQETALRETHEELGIPPQEIEIVAALEPEYVAISGFLVSPYIGRWAGPPVFSPDPREVARVIEVPLAALRDPANYREEDRGRYIRRSPIYQHGADEIWGATARMLVRILAHAAIEA